MYFGDFLQNYDFFIFLLSIVGISVSDFTIFSKMGRVARIRQNVSISEYFVLKQLRNVNLLDASTYRGNFGATLGSLWVHFSYMMVTLWQLWCH